MASTTSTSDPAFSKHELAENWLTPAFYHRLNDYWFRKYSPEALYPDPGTVQSWYKRDEKNDEHCRYVPPLASP